MDDSRENLDLDIIQDQLARALDQESKNQSINHRARSVEENSL